jgi:asparagine synthase (glutamine-hydrolysing)
MGHESWHSSGTLLAPEFSVYGGWVAHPDSVAAARQQNVLGKSDLALLLYAGDFVEGVDIPQLYDCQGESCFPNLNGLFSGLLIDRQRRKILLFNDRYGLERIYWHEANGEFYFASEAKALLRVLPSLREFDPEGVGEFLALGCTMGSRTLFKGVQLLPGGALWTFENGSCRKGTYFSPSEWESSPPLVAEDFEVQFQETFKRVLPRYFAPESRVGISLTGGLDSRMIMACRPEMAEEPVCYTFTGTNGQTLDDRLAAKVAEACGLDHHLLRIGPDFFSDFAAHADRTVYVTDGSFGVLGAHEIYFNRMARDLAPFRLTGNFGSEVLRGVSTFKPLGLTADVIDPKFSPVIKAAARAHAEGEAHHITAAAFQNIPWNLFGSLAAGRSQTIFRTPYLDNEIVALAYQIPDHLRTSPVPSANLIRNSNPILGNIPADMGQIRMNGRRASALRRLFGKVTFKLDYLNNEGFPNWLLPLDPLFKTFASRLGVIGLHKYLHYRSWLQGDLSGYLRETAARLRGRGSPFWNSAFVEGMVSDHLQGRRNYVAEINAVFTLEAVERLLFRDLPCRVESSTVSPDRSAVSPSASVS